jgi:hypothetical protein
MASATARRPHARGDGWRAQSRDAGARGRLAGIAIMTALIVLLAAAQARVVAPAEPVQRSPHRTLDRPLRRVFRTWNPADARGRRSN